MEPTPEAAEPVKKYRSNWRAVREWAQVIIIAGILALVLRTYIIEPFIVEGASMDPTFATGQFLLVDRLTYRLHPPTRYDVIVFQYPKDPSVDYIKRIIGLPGETVTIKDGIATIVNPDHPNGIILPQPFVEASHQSFDSETVTLGQDQYFVMGDNRAQSYDSRAWGSVPKNLIIGRPILRILPPSTISLLPGGYNDNTYTK